MIFSKVVLPQPDGPNKAYAPPSFQSIFTSRSAQSSLLFCFRDRFQLRQFQARLPPPMGRLLKAQQTPRKEALNEG